MAEYKGEEPTVSTNRDSIIETLDGIHVYGLANRADTYSPDREDSPGAAFLSSVRDSVTELLSTVNAEEWADMDGDAWHELADSAVPIYTSQRWQVFADLGAWNEDVSDFGPVEDMTDAAGVALYLIAERLAGVLVGEAVDSLEVDEEADVSSS